LFSLTQDRHGFKTKLFLLLKSKSIHIDILICENVDYIVKSMTDLTAPEFGNDLEHSIKIFHDWQNDIKNNKWPGSINVRFSRKLGNLSLTFFDPGDDHGMLLLTPVVQSHASGRPCVWLTKKEHTHIFNHYQMVYESMLRDI
jgi:hypothetical protein